MKSVTKIDENVFAVGGECDIISIVDVRASGVVTKMRMNDLCSNLTKIYPYSLLITCGKNLKIYDIRKQN